MSDPVIVVTPKQLARLIRRAVSRAFQDATTPPALLDRNGLAEALGCSASQVDKLRKQGMPYVRLGESPRFELEPCLVWLRNKD